VGAKALTFTRSSDFRSLPSALKAKAHNSDAKAIDVIAKASYFKAKAHSLHATGLDLSAKASHPKHQKNHSDSAPAVVLSNLVPK